MGQRAVTIQRNRLRFGGGSAPQLILDLRRPFSVWRGHQFVVIIIIAIFTHGGDLHMICPSMEHIYLSGGSLAADAAGRLAQQRSGITFHARCRLNPFLDPPRGKGGAPAS
jgi:hypothetical protein